MGQDPSRNGRKYRGAPKAVPSSRAPAGRVGRGRKEAAGTATWDDFQKLDLRVGRVLTAEEFPEARQPAYKLTIDFGPLGTKRSSAQITDLYEAEALVGRLVVAVVNFPPKQIANFLSEVLVLGAMEDRGVVLLRPDADVRPGTKIG